MKTTRIQVERLVRKILAELKTQKIMTVKVADEQVFARAIEVVLKDLETEAALDREVNVMLDDLERKNPGEFHRHKMFGMLKKRLAQEKGMVL